MTNVRSLWLLLVAGVLAAVAALMVSATASGAAGQECFGLTVTVSLANGDEPSDQFGEVILGTTGDDEIFGTNGNDVICGGGGDDIIQAGAGDDRVRGGRGNDQLFGGPGRDRLFGGRGNDFIHAGQRPGRIDGGRGIDDCVGNRRGMRCEPSCLVQDVSRVSDNDTFELDGPREAKRCQFKCGTGCDVDAGLAVYVSTDAGYLLRLEHVDSAFDPAGPLPRVLPSGDTVMTIRFVNQPVPCPEGAPQTIEVLLTDIGNEVRHQLRRSTCGLAFTAQWDG